MIEANRAYEAGHHETLEALLEAGQVTEELAAASPELVWLTRRVAELKEQVVKLEAELADITSSELYRLKLRVENADALGVDLFVDLLMQVDRQIKKARNRLEALQGVMMTA
jgi:chromosome segregation ATPase